MTQKRPKPVSGRGTPDGFLARLSEMDQAVAEAARRRAGDEPAPASPAPRAVAGQEILDALVARLSALGFAVSPPAWVPDADQAVCDVALSGRPLCRVEFSAFGDRYSLNALPADRSSATLIGHATGRLHQSEAVYVEDSLARLEALFRSALVREGRLPEDEFATDYALRSWVTRAATVRLPHERSARTRHIHDVVIHPGDLPDERHRSSTPASKAIVQACRLLDVAFDRSRAIEVARAAASQVVEARPDGTPVDHAQSFLAHTARFVMRGQRRDMDLSWDKGGLDRVLALHGAERDDMRVPLALSEETPAPRMW